jgi:hypothetical protein
LGVTIIWRKISLKISLENNSSDAQELSKDFRANAKKAKCQL